MKYPVFLSAFLLVLSACSSGNFDSRDWSLEEKKAYAQQVIDGFDEMALPYSFDGSLLQKENASALKVLSDDHFVFLNQALGYEVIEDENGENEQFEYRKVGRFTLTSGTNVLVMVGIRAGEAVGVRLIGAKEQVIKGNKMILNRVGTGSKSFELSADGVLEARDQGDRYIYRIYGNGDIFSAAAEPSFFPAPTPQPEDSVELEQVETAE